MKKVLGVLLMIFLYQNAFSQGLEFQDLSFDETLAKAKKEKKMVFVDCYTVWCTPCKAMDKNVFPQKEVGDFFNANFVCIKMDMEKGEGPDLLKRYDVRAYPTLLYLDANGKVLYKRVGGIDTMGLIADGKLAMNPNERLDIIKAQYEAGDRNPEFVFKYIELLSKNYLVEERAKVGKAYFETITNEDLLKAENFEKFMLIGTDIHKEKFKFVCDNKARFIAISDDKTVDQFILQTNFKNLRDFAKGSDIEKLNSEVSSFKKQFPDLPPASFNSLYDTHYLLNKKFEKWFEFVEENMKSVDPKYISHEYGRKAIDLSKSPHFSESPIAVNKALEWMDKVIELREDPLNYYYIAFIHERSGNKSEALKFIDIYMEKNLAKTGKVDENAVTFKKQIEAM